MSLSKVFERLCKSGIIKPLEPRSLPNSLSPNHNPKEFCKYHQLVGYNIDNRFKLRHAMQDLIDQGKIPNSKYTKHAQKVKKVMMLEEESINKEFMMKHFELINSRKNC